MARDHSAMQQARIVNTIVAAVASLGSDHQGGRRDKVQGCAGGENTDTNITESCCEFYNAREDRSVSGRSNLSTSRASGAREL
jgi:hypothetical protein